MYVPKVQILVGCVLHLYTGEFEHWQIQRHYSTSEYFIACNSYFDHAGESDRKKFLERMPPQPTTFHTVDRENILYSTVISLFKKKGIEDEFPLRITFKGERSQHWGSLSRHAVCLLARSIREDLTPVVHPETDPSSLPVMGKILSHGYLSSGFLPVKIAFPALAVTLLRINEVSDNVLVTTFMETVEAATLSRAFTVPEFSGDMQVRLASILGRFGCRQLPSVDNLRQLLLQVAKFQFITKPSSALQAISSGIPMSHREFWKQLSVKELYDIYLALTASPDKVLEQLELSEGDPANSNQQRVFDYLTQYVGNMKNDEVRRFLRFVTGASVCFTERIVVSFNTLTGIARRPIAHTCSSLLILSSTYQTFEEFAKKFRAIVFGDEEWWKLDGI